MNSVDINRMARQADVLYYGPTITRFADLIYAAAMEEAAAICEATGSEAGEACAVAIREAALKSRLTGVFRA